MGQVLFNDVVQKLGVLESDYFDLEYLDIHGVHVSTLYTGVRVCVCVQYFVRVTVHNTSVCLRIILITKSSRTVSKRAYVA